MSPTEQEQAYGKACEAIGSYLQGYADAAPCPETIVDVTLAISVAKCTEAGLSLESVLERVRSIYTHTQKSIARRSAEAS